MDIKPRVLVVEDLQEYQRLFSRYINKLGYTCDIAESAHTAKDALNKSSYHVALLDLSLKKLDPNDREGFVILDMIKRLNEGTKVIIASAYGGLNDANKALKEYHPHLFGFIEKDEIKQDAVMEQIKMGVEQAQKEMMQPNRHILNLPALFGNETLEKVTKSLSEAINKPLEKTEDELRKFLNRLLLELLPLLPAKLEAKIQYESKKPTIRLRCWSKRLGEPIETWFGPYNIMKSLVQPINLAKFKHQFGYKTEINEVFDHFSLADFGGIVYTIDSTDFSQFISKRLD